MKMYELWHRRLNVRDETGFTLAELLVVILILGILTSISIGIFLNQRRKAWDTAIKADLRDASTAQEAYFTDYSRYAADVAGLQSEGFKFSNAASYPNDAPTMTITLAPNSMSYCLAATSKSGQNWYLGSETTLGTVAC